MSLSEAAAGGLTVYANLTFGRPDIEMEGGLL